MKYTLGEKHPTLDLYRVVAAKDFGNVSKGDVGGWIEKESNLSHDGNCWLYGSARVSGDAWVFGNARVSGDAWVFGSAWVSGDAWVSGNALVYGNAWVSGDAQVSGDAWECSPLHIVGTKHSVTTCTLDHLQIGCYKLTIAEWKKQYKDIGKQNGYTDIQIEEYGLYIKLAEKWLKLHTVEEVV